jgi:hypothetical protein
LIEGKSPSINGIINYQLPINNFFQQILHS